MASRRPVGWKGQAVTKLIWRGKEVEDHVNRATIAGLNETMAACVAQAKINAPVLTGDLKKDIQITQPATIRNVRITGSWGNKTVKYAFFQEFGTVNNPPRYYLRRAADQEYPKTAQRIRSHM